MSLSFQPKVKMSISEYRPNPMNSINNNLDTDEVLKGSFNPDYVMAK
jgi:hypothetical protein